MEYFNLPLPARAPSLEKIAAARAAAAKLAAAAEGLAVVLPYAALPLWYYFLLFSELYPRAAEITVQLKGGEHLLLHSDLPEKEYARPSSIVYFKDIIKKPAKRPVETVDETEFNLCQLPLAAPGNLKKIISLVKKQLVFSDRVVFIGETDIASGLVALAMWYGWAVKAEYKIKDKIISI